MLPQHAAVESAAPAQTPLTFLPGNLPESEAAEARWPKVVGIVSIILGILGLFQHAFGLLGTLAMGAIMGSEMGRAAIAEEPGAAVAFESVGEFIPYLTLVEVARLGLGALLIAGGAMLVMRKSASSSVMLLWVSLETVAVIGVTIIQYESQQAQVQVMQRTGGGVPAGFDQIAGGIGMLGAVIGLALGLLFPLIVALYMLLPKNAALIASWRGGHTLRHEV